MKTKPNVEPTTRFVRGLAVGLAVFAALLGLATGAWIWTFRDGLGPGAESSTGFEAWGRFLSDFWPVGLVCLVLLAASLTLLWRRRER